MNSLVALPTAFAMDHGSEYQKYINEGIESGYRLSWVSHVIPFLVTLFFCSIGVALYQWIPIVGIVVCAFFLILFVSGVLSRRSVNLYFNEHGIWVRSGILPWTKGVNGVQWRDIDDAVYYTGFIAWAFNSYRIRVGHRFTKGSEIFLWSVADGRKFVEEVNRRMIERQRSQAIDSVAE